MSVTDDLLRNAAAYANVFERGRLPRPPAMKLAVVTCMDSRINPFSLLNLREGDAHMIRNAGGVITDDEIRSLAISQRLMGTREIIVMHHTDCGMQNFSDHAFREMLEERTGVPVPWRVEGFGDIELDVRVSIQRVRESPFLLHRDKVRGFVYEVETGVLREVESPA